MTSESGKFYDLKKIIDKKNKQTVNRLKLFRIRKEIKDKNLPLLMTKKKNKN